MLETVRQLGFLQLDPISTVAPPQHLVLWSRLGSFDPAALDRLLWEERKLVEWRAFLWPIEDLPLLQARMRSNRIGKAGGPRGNDYLKANASFRRYVLRELDARGPLLSREIEDHSSMNRDPHNWWGVREMGMMLEVLAGSGEVAVVGRRGKQRVWDPAGAGIPDGAISGPGRAAGGEAVPRAGRVRLDKGWIAHPDVVDGSVPDRIVFLSPFDRLIHDRARTGRCGISTTAWMYVPRAKRSTATRLRSARRQARRQDRSRLRQEDRRPPRPGRLVGARRPPGLARRPAEAARPLRRRGAGRAPAWCLTPRGPLVSHTGRRFRV